MTQLDASYNPSRQLINQQISALPSQSDAQIAGLKATQADSFNQIQQGAQDRGLGFSGIPLADQAKYTASTFLPAVAQVQQSQNQNQNTLLGALNNLGIDQTKTANGIQAQQVQNDIAQQQADAAARAAAASSNALGGLFDSGAQPPAPTQTSTTTDPYAKVDKQGAANAIVSLLKTNNAGLVNQTMKAIQSSASNGNLYDQYKLALINSYLNNKGTAYNNTYANLIRSAQTYKAPAAPAKKGYPTMANTPNTSDFIKQRALLYGF